MKTPPHARRLCHGGLLAALLLLAAPSARAGERFVLDPAATTVRFTLAATLHTVEGSLVASQGAIAFDRASGEASGRIVLDARSATTELAARDENMHSQVLLSERHPEIVFFVTGLDVEPTSESAGSLRLRGEVELLGRRHPLEIPGEVVLEDGRVRVQSEFTIPYVAWGLRDGGNFLLRVAPEVQVVLEAHGVLEPTSD